MPTGPTRSTRCTTSIPEKAKSLLEEAGWTDSDGDGIRDKDGVKFEWECCTRRVSATYEQQLPYMQQAWKDVG